MHKIIKMSLYRDNINFNAITTDKL